MKRGNSEVPFSELGSTPAKQKIDFKKTTDYSQGAINKRRAKQDMVAHDTADEKVERTGNTCMECGKFRDDHKDAGHTFVKTFGAK